MDVSAILNHMVAIPVSALLILAVVMFLVGFIAALRMSMAGSGAIRR